jgi:collagenase-like PrtC family protease
MIEMNGKRSIRMNKVEVVAPAGSLTSLKAAVENGADVIYTGFKGATSGRNYEGLNFTYDEMGEGINVAHEAGKKVYIAINTFPQFDDHAVLYGTVDDAYSLGVDAVILANIGILKYTKDTYPELPIHLSTQASASNYESINFYKKHFDIKRVVLPRVLTIDEMKSLKEKIDVEVEVFALGGLCINTEGRCYLSSFVTGASTNTEGACSPSRFVRFEASGESGMRIVLNNKVLNEYDSSENAAYPTCCKGRYLVDGKKSYAFEDPESLNIVDILPQVIETGVDALKIEGRQRTKSYVATVTRALRNAVDLFYSDPEGYGSKVAECSNVHAAFEGTRSTVGCYLRK